MDGIDVTADGKTLQFAKDNTEWKITQPLQARADYGSVEGLIGRLQTTAMKSIVADAATPEDLKKYGLDKPAGDRRAEDGQRAGDVRHRRTRQPATEQAPCTRATRRSRPSSPWTACSRTT